MGGGLPWPRAGGSELLLGNEAVVRGAVEARVGLVSGYPGTPASEIGDTFAAVHDALGIRFEYSVNEKIALELAFGASLTGARALVSMKHLGLSVGADPLSTMPYLGVVGGLVIVSAADPGCHTSPNEQDQRYLAKMLGLPTLEPMTPDEASRMTSWAFDLSEACELPVLLRITTRVCHTRTPVELREPGPRRPPPRFRRDHTRFVPTPNNARRLRVLLDQRLELARTWMTASEFNSACGSDRAEAAGVRGVVAAGAARTVVRSVLARLAPGTPLLELGTLHPLPEPLIESFLGSVQEVLVVEDLAPFVEDALAAIAHRAGLSARVHGKHDRMMPGPFEMLPHDVEAGVRALLGLEASPLQARPVLQITAPPRPPVLCAGCPHRSTFHAVTSVFEDRHVYVNDIGCYTLGAEAPHHAGDVLLAMGSSPSIASGIARMTGERVVALLGDSTFFHSGLPAVLNVVGDDVVVVVLDNHTTAMTGQQPTAATNGGGACGGPGRIEALARALGVRQVETVPADDLSGLIGALERAKCSTHLSVVVSEGPCALLERIEPPGPAPQVDGGRCHTCGMAQAGLHCELPPSPSLQRQAASRRVLQPAGSRSRDDSPCSLACPLGVCVPALTSALAGGDAERAARALDLRSALPSVCAHICHRPCEAFCVQHDDGEPPVAIGALERYLAARPRTPPTRRERSGPAVAVVGAGPAGLAAARELARRGLTPTLFDARERPGGMLEYAVPPDRLPRDVLHRDIEAVLGEGVRFEGGVRFGQDLTLDDLRARGFAATLLALGADRPVPATFPGSDLPGVVEVLALLQGLPPTGQDLAGQDLVLVGAGDVAFHAARLALQRGAATATVVAPEPAADVSASLDAVQLALQAGVRIVDSSTVVSVTAGPDGTANGVVLGRVHGFRRTADGIRWDGVHETVSLPARAVVLAADHRPTLTAFEPGDPLIGRGGLLAGDEYGRTPVADVFVAGDAVTGPANATSAMASGVRAAWAIDAYLAEGRRVPGPAAPPPPPPPPPRLPHPLAAGPVPSGTPLDANAAAETAARCIQCGLCRDCTTCTDLLGCPAINRTDVGTAVIDPHECRSCQLCIQVCPNGAITNGAITNGAIT